MKKAPSEPNERLKYLTHASFLGRPHKLAWRMSVVQYLPLWGLCTSAAISEKPRLPCVMRAEDRLALAALFRRGLHAPPTAGFERA